MAGAGTFKVSGPDDGMVPVVVPEAFFDESKKAAWKVSAGWPLTETLSVAPGGIGAVSKEYPQIVISLTDKVLPLLVLAQLTKKAPPPLLPAITATTV